MITKKYLTEATPSEKDEIRKLHRNYSIIKENKQGVLLQEQFDFSLDGIKNIVPYWADKLGYDSDDIDVSVEGVKNMASWWSDELTDIVKDKVESKGGTTDPEKLMDEMYNQMRSVYDKLPSKNTVVSTIKSVFMPWTN